MPMCKHFLFSVCRRPENACKHYHRLLRCPTSCGKNLCKFFHLTEALFAEFCSQRRPFLQEIQEEVNRVAYAYLKEGDKELCSAVLTGGQCTAVQCLRCYPKHGLVVCKRCTSFLTRTNTYRLDCCHVVCGDCVEFLPVRVDALMLYECPVCKEYGLPIKLYG
ncbi:hypothetical protein PPYR_09335 [Photinus pyralis]|uniref:RING-type domain-containing protein n=2 Tax=Photinus pyralis TaxID=7054 RepID=A0A5N4ALW7_PHOPY|nr:hypothetical protein PPYR_09335 [Photinus pyralis]